MKFLVPAFLQKYSELNVSKPQAHTLSSVARPYCDVIYMATMNHTTGMNLEVTL